MKVSYFSTRVTSAHLWKSVYFHLFILCLNEWAMIFYRSGDSSHCPPLLGWKNCFVKVLQSGCSLELTVSRTNQLIITKTLKLANGSYTKIWTGSSRTFWIQWKPSRNRARASDWITLKAVILLSSQVQIYIDQNQNLGRRSSSTWLVHVRFTGYVEEFAVQTSNNSFKVLYRWGEVMFFDLRSVQPALPSKSEFRKLLYSLCMFKWISEDAGYTIVMKCCSATRIVRFKIIAHLRNWLRDFCRAYFCHLTM